MRGLRILNLVFQFICLICFICEAVKGIQVDAWIVVLWVVNAMLLQWHILEDED